MKRGQGKTTRQQSTALLIQRWQQGQLPLDLADIPLQTRVMTQTALITGASRGLGAAFAKALAPTHHIIAVARTIGALEELDDEIRSRGGQSTLAPMDITTKPAMAQLCRGIYDRWNHLDLWVHTAIHAAPLSPAPHIDDRDWEKSFAINVDATQHLITMLAPLLGQTGQAVFFDDAAGGHKFFGSYGATKSAQIALAKSWQAETISTGPRITIMTPAPMPTAIRARFFPGEDRASLAEPALQARRLLTTIL